MAELGLFELLASLFEGGLTLGNVLIGGIAITILITAVIVFIRCIREKISPLEAIGFRNGYLKESTYAEDSKEIKEILRDHKASINVRFDKLELADKELREEVQDLNKVVCKLSGEFEQFRRD